MVLTILRRRCTPRSFMSALSYSEKLENVRPDESIHNNNKSSDPYLVRRPPVLPIQRYWTRMLGRSTEESAR